MNKPWNYTERAELRRKYVKLSIGGDMLQQVICTIKVRRAPARHDNVDFRPLVERTSAILPLSVVVADKGYDSEDNHVHVLVRRTQNRELVFRCIAYNTHRVTNLLVIVIVFYKANLL